MNILSMLFGSKKITDLKNVADRATKKIDKFVYLVELFVVVSLILISIYFLIKIYFYFQTNKVKHLKSLLCRFYTEIKFLHDKDNLTEERRKVLEQEHHETLGLLIKSFRKRYIFKKIGQTSLQRILDGLNLIYNKKINLADQLDLVQNWIRLADTYLS